ncbi:MAG: hypothetical protein ACI9GZ_003853 [Bacteroidia bacterium]|jgi:hypothetical protein
MNRRVFINSGLTSLCVVPLLGFKAFENENPTWLIEWIRIHDKSLPTFKPNKIIDSSNKYVGGYLDAEEIPNPHTTAGFLGKACMLFSCSDSTYYLSKAVLSDIEDASKALLKFQHSDGTIDLLSTNFHSTPDTAFVLENIIPSYKFLLRSKTKGLENAIEHLKSFIQNAGEALIVGGVHTPNHRWVVSAALTKVNELFPDKRYLDRIDQWLAEHIDIDPDGQFTEKSTNGYSPIVDRALIDMAIGLNIPELYDAVRKNLAMSLFYIHPNGEVVTEASNRQDRGSIDFMCKYYYCYRYMALLDNSGEMAAACRLIEKTCKPQQLAGYLTNFLENPSLLKDLPTSKALPISYAKAFPYSGLARIRRGNWDCTLLSNNAAWLTFHKGNSVLQAMRMSGSFFGKGQFETERIEQIGDTWVLSKTLEGPYYQPLEKDKISPDGDLSKMPRSLRKKSEIQTLQTTVKVKETKSGIEVDIEMSGTDNVPVSFEIIFRAGGTFSGVNEYAQKENAYLFSGEIATYSVGTDVISFGPGKLEHKGLQLRGALPSMDAPTVYLTGTTPFKHTLFLS